MTLVRIIFQLGPITWNYLSSVPPTFPSYILISYNKNMKNDCYFRISNLLKIKLRKMNLNLDLQADGIILASLFISLLTLLNVPSEGTMLSIIKAMDPNIL